MTTDTIIRILNLHSIPYQVCGDHILVDSMIAGTTLFERTEDVTDWTRRQLYSWLGY